MRPALKVGLLFAAGVWAAVRGRAPRGETPAAALEEHRDGGFGAWLKRQLWTAAKYFVLFSIVMAVGGFLLAASGVIPIKASSGHWAVTRWFLQFSKQRSVSTHSLGAEAPPLDGTRLVLKGAGAYETNCLACHGSPALPAPRVARGMTPQPPYLSTVLSRYEDEEVFYIVKHGIKFTGMPAWPAQTRDDEVWAMVAFLRALPRLDAGGYERLVRGEAAASGEVEPMPEMTGPRTVPRAITVSCARCHGADGAGRGEGAFPRLAGQRPDYLALSLQAYARSERHSGVMEPNAAGLSVEEMRELALYYAGLPKAPPPTPAPDTIPAIRRGEAIVRQGIPARRVPSCASCHGPGTAPRNPVYPDLAGQYAEYLILQLELFQKQQRGGTAYAHLMHSVAAQLTPEQMRDVALYYASLAPAPASPSP